MEPQWVLTGQQKKVRFRNLLNKRHQIEQRDQQVNPQLDGYQPDLLDREPPVTSPGDMRGAGVTSPQSSEAGSFPESVEVSAGATVATAAAAAAATAHHYHSPNQYHLSPSPPMHMADMQSKQLYARSQISERQSSHRGGSPSSEPRSKALRPSTSNGGTATASAAFSGVLLDNGSPKDYLVKAARAQLNSMLPAMKGDQRSPHQDEGMYRRSEQGQDNRPMLHGGVFSAPPPPLPSTSAMKPTQPTLPVPYRSHPPYIPHRGGVGLRLHAGLDPRLAGAPWRAPWDALKSQYHQQPHHHHNRAGYRHGGPVTGGGGQPSNELPLSDMPDFLSESLPPRAGEHCEHVGGTHYDLAMMPDQQASYLKESQQTQRKILNTAHSQGLRK